MHQSSMQELTEKKRPKDSYVLQAKANRVTSIVPSGNGSFIDNFSYVFYY